MTARRRLFILEIGPGALVDTPGQFFEVVGDPPDGKELLAYSFQFTTSGGGSGLFAWSVASGSLPDGLTLSAGGLLSGSPEETGTFVFTVRALDSVTGRAATRPCEIAIEQSLKTDLVAWWAFSSGGENVDSHIFGYNMVETGSVLNNSDGMVGFGSRTDGGANNGARRRTDALAQDFDFLTDSFTVAGWFRQTTSNTTILSKSHTTGGDNWQWALYLNGGRISFRIWQNDGGTPVDTEVVGSAWNDDGWHYAVATFDRASGEANVYIDDVLDASASGLTGDPLWEANVQMTMHDLDSSGVAFASACRLDEIAVWRRVLSADERAVLYNGGSGMTYTDITS